MKLLHSKNIAIILIGVFAYRILFAITISKSFDLNNDRKTDFKIFINKDYTISIIDSDFNGNLDQVIINSKKQRIVLQRNNLLFTKYFKKSKLTIESIMLQKLYFINSFKLVNLISQSLNSKEPILNTSDFSEFQLVDSSEPFCSNIKSNLNEIKVIDSKISTDVLNVNYINCLESQKSQINEILDNITKNDIKFQRQTDQIIKCINTLPNNFNIPTNIFHRLIQKMEEINNGVSNLTIKCSNERDSKCKDVFGLALIDEIIICYRSNLKNQELKEILKHEIYHLKGLELNDKQISEINLCSSHLNSSLNSNLVSEEKVTAKSEEIVAQREFNPALELKTKPVIALEKQQDILQKELTSDPPNTERRLPPNNEIDRIASANISVGNRIMNEIIPYANAAQTGVVAKNDFTNNSRISSNEPFKKINKTFTSPKQEVLLNHGITPTSKISNTAILPRSTSIEKVNQIVEKLDNPNDTRTTLTGEHEIKGNLSEQKNTRFQESNRPNENNDIAGTKPTLITSSPPISASAKSISGRTISSNSPPPSGGNHISNITSRNMDNPISYLRSKPNVQDVKIKLATDKLFQNEVNRNNIGIYFKKDKKLTQINPQVNDPKYIFTENELGKLIESKSPVETALFNEN